MLDSLYIAATGMHAQQTRHRHDLEQPRQRQHAGVQEGPRRLPGPDVPRAGARQRPRRQRRQLGAQRRRRRRRPAASKLFTAGDLKKTDAPLDLAIRGRGFFEVLLPDGTHAFTRAGALQIDKDGMLATAEGHVLEPSIQIPDDAASVDHRDRRPRAGGGARREASRSRSARSSSPTSSTRRACSRIGDNLYLRDREVRRRLHRQARRGELRHASRRAFSKRRTSSWSRSSSS